MSRLQSLDASALPGLADRLRHWSRRAGQLRGGLTARARSLQPQQLDDRYAGKGPLRLADSRPVLATAVTVAVLAAGLGVALDREGDVRPSRSASVPSELIGQGGSALPGALLGPSIGDSTSDYERGASRALVAAAAADPAQARVALVSLADYRDPRQAEALLAGFSVQRVYLRAKEAGSRAAPLPVDVKGPLLPALRKAYADTARARRAAQVEYRRYVDALQPTGAQSKAYRQLYADFAESTGIEATQYAGDCACVYAALVSATTAQLLSLRARPGVRAVQAAGEGLNALQVQVQPLLPEVQGVVPRPTLAVPHS